ncbi:Mediator complex subunit Med23 [Trinorchestia longiramus]|nr:Mediator complex subunit Med23 [Trinorchestia longiramus]
MILQATVLVVLCKDLSKILKLLISITGGSTQEAMEDQVKLVETKVLEVFGDIAHQGDPLQQNLFNYLKLDDPDKAEQKLTTVFLELQKLLGPPNQTAAEQSSETNRPPSVQESSKAAQEAGVKQLVSVLSVRHNPVQAHSVATIIRKLATANTIPPKLLCVTVLTHEKLKPENTVFWTTAFGLIKDVIIGVDYKGVREIMKMCLECCNCNDVLHSTNVFGVLPL